MRSSRVLDAGASQLTPRQQEANRLLAGPARHVLLYGGGRSGKTFLIVRAIVIRALKAPGSRHAIWRFRYNHVRASVWLDTLPKVMAVCFPGVAAEDKRQDGYVALPNGSELWFGGLDEKERVERVLGQEYSTIFFNECSQIPFASVITALTRLAQVVHTKDGRQLRQRAWFDENPPSVAHYTHRWFIEHRDPSSKSALENIQDFAAMSVNPVDNPHLSAEYLASLRTLPERQRRRFLEGRFTSDTEGALWTLDVIEASRAAEQDVPPLGRVVVGIDPSGASGPEDKRSDEIGIVAGGRGADGRLYLLGDYSLRAGPDAWAAAALAAYDKHEADCIVAERNYGGEMVRDVIRSRRPAVPVRLVTASRGKHVRAEPVSALYQSEKVRHVGRFPELEDQLLAFTNAGYVGDRSPDRADAWVWAASSLMMTCASDADSAGPIQIDPGPGHGGDAFHRPRQADLRGMAGLGGIALG